MKEINFENVTKTLNKINKDIYGVEPFKEKPKCGFRSCNCDITPDMDCWEEVHRNMYDTP